MVLDVFDRHRALVLPTLLGEGHTRAASQLEGECTVGWEALYAYPGDPVPNAYTCYYTAEMANDYLQELHDSAEVMALLHSVFNISAPCQHRALSVPRHRGLKRTWVRASPKRGATLPRSPHRA